MLVDGLPRSIAATTNRETPMRSANWACVNERRRRAIRMFRPRRPSAASTAAGGSFSIAVGRGTDVFHGTFKGIMLLQTNIQGNFCTGLDEPRHTMARAKGTALARRSKRASLRPV